MSCKKVELIINSSRTPYSLTIQDAFGRNLANGIVNSSRARFCIRTKGCQLRLIARYQNVTIFRTIYLFDCRCQRAFVSLGFASQFAEVVNLFTLQDEIYGLPVPETVLNFESKGL